MYRGHVMGAIVIIGSQDGGRKELAKRIESFGQAVLQVETIEEAYAHHRQRICCLVIIYCSMWPLPLSRITALGRC